MRTWSVSGTAFALCTRSSSLSIRTNTSIDLRSLQRKPAGSAALPEPTALRRLRFRLGFGLGRRLLSGLAGTGDPAPAARSQRFEKLLGFAARYVYLGALVSAPLASMRGLRQHVGCAHLPH